MVVPFAEYEEHDGVGLAALIRRGEVSSAEVVAAALERIERHEPALGAVVERWLDRAPAREPALPDTPLAGVPTLLKDLIHYAGHKVAMGSRLMADFVAPESHEVVRRLERAGLIFLGKTNTSELGLLPTTECALWGPVHNPWNPARSAGGSSGGSAAAVAVGIVPLAHGNDGGGSIRIPASACGIFGLKPSRGRTPGAPWDEPTGIVSEGFLSRTVRDSAAALDLVAGARHGDRWWAPPPERPFLQEVEHDPGPLKIALMPDSLVAEPIDSACTDAVRSAGALLEELGHHVEETRPDIDVNAFIDAFFKVWYTIPGGVIAQAGQHLREHTPLGKAVRLVGPRRLLRLISRLTALRGGDELLEPWTWMLAERDARQSTGDLWLAWNTLREAAARLAELHERYDLFLSPVLGARPFPLGRLRPEMSFDEIREILIQYTQFTPICNVAGVPAMSVPLYWSDDGLPVGVHVVARFGDEATLFRLAGQLERARPWSDRRPPSRSA